MFVSTTYQPVAFSDWEWDKLELLIFVLRGFAVECLCPSVKIRTGRVDGSTRPVPTTCRRSARTVASFYHAVSVADIRATACSQISYRMATKANLLHTPVPAPIYDPTPNP